ncbi:MAG: type III-B CRISPR module-associated protein Cmr3 [Deltaproteobacteria bacterium]|nr:MAG: type III-B CRISPR module-associated protein Cmr3 [Deltaproteobacteria bacterium]
MTFSLEPLDTCFFRDGRPFTAGDSAQWEVAGTFPPPPPTLVGALRAALARGNGWNGEGRWPEALDAVLGSGYEDLGALHFRGPFVLKDDAPLFPVPRHLLGRVSEGGWVPEALLRPGEPVACDLGPEVRLPELPAGVDEPASLKGGAHLWCSREGLEAVLAGRLPQKEQILSAAALWAEEGRVGLERDRTTRTAVEGRLYSAVHVRPARGVALGMVVENLPEDFWVPDGELVPLGGESRLAACRRLPIDLGVGEGVRAKLARLRRGVAVALTPVLLDQAVYQGEVPMEGLPGTRVVSACLERPLRIGGWNGLERRPLPMASALPPGSVLFWEAEDQTRFDAFMGDTATDSVVQVGARTRWGFGVVALGLWPNDGEDA